MKISNFLKKDKFKYFVKIVLSALVICYLVITPVTILPTLLERQNLVNKEPDLEYVGVLELWNIDTFEGGSVSRTRWLEKRALEFENIHKGTYIMVTNMTKEQAILNLENGKCPNLFSFGIGVGEQILPYLQEYTGEINCRNDLIYAGKFENKTYAVPYILGGYMIAGNSQISENINNVGYGGASDNNVELALLLNNYKLDNIYKDSNKLDSFNAYDKYLRSNFNYLCGTQRDAYRLDNKLANGKISNQSFEYLSGFSDLIQYIAVGKCEASEVKISTSFAEYVTSDKAQRSLTNISMFSVNKTDLYSSGYLKEMEKALSGELKTINVFLSESKLKELKTLSNDCLKNKDFNKNEFKKYLCN